MFSLCCIITLVSNIKIFGEKMQADIHKMYDEIIETGQIKEKESPVDGEAYTDIEELQHDYLAMIKAVVDMLDGAKYLWQK